MASEHVVETFKEIAAGERLDYVLDYTNLLIDSDTITSSVWAVQSDTVGGLVEDGTNFSTTATLIWADAVTGGTRHFLVNTVETTFGRIFVKRLHLTVLPNPTP